MREAPQSEASAPRTAPMPREVVDLVRPEVRAERAYRVVTETGGTAKLDQNESPFDLPLEIKQRALDRFARTEWNRYPQDRPHRLVQALAQKLDWPVTGLIVGRGSNELIHTLGLCFMLPGRRVVLPRPMFALFESVARMQGAEVVPVDARPDFSHRIEDMLEAMHTSEAPLTVVCTPNNPTGHAFSYDELVEMAEAAEGILVLDEAYVEFGEGPTAVDVARQRPNVLVLRTLSKAMGLAGLRIGYMAGHPELIAEIEKSRLPFLVDELSESVALAMLEHDDLVRERAREMVSERRRIVAELRSRRDVEVVESSANFFLLRADLAPAELQERLLDEGVRVRNMAAYAALAGGPGPSGRFDTGWVRVSVGTARENSDFLVALERVLR